MTIKIQRGRQFAATDTTVQVFDATGKAGSYLQKAADKLVAQNMTVVVRGPSNKKLTLATAADWKAFLEKNCATKEQTDAFAKKAGITFGDFLNAVDDAAASDDKGLTLDLRPTSTLGKALSLDKVDGDYGKKLAKDATVNLTGANGATGTVQAVGVPTIGKEILANPVSSNWERDRTELENWGDFKTGDGASDKFKANTGPAPYAKLYQPKWDDPKAMEIVNSFAMPLHLEVKSTNPDGTTKFQDGYEMFRDTYFDDKNGALDKAGASVRSRVRFDNNDKVSGTATAGAKVTVSMDGTEIGTAVADAAGKWVLDKSIAMDKAHTFTVVAKDAAGNSAGWATANPPFAVNRVLVQAKEGRAVTGTDSAVHKFEKRWEGGYTDENAAKEQLVNGKETGGSTLAVSQKLYQLAQDKGTLGKDGNLQLEEKYTVLQKRRRTHLQLDSVSDVSSRKTSLKTEMDALTAAGKPVPPAMEAYGKKLDDQIKFLTDASTALQKYGQYMPSGECFIVSADRYTVFDAAARKGNPPTDIDDEVGRIGKGPLHIEAEWDTASSDPFEKAVTEIDKRIKATPPPDAATLATLQADRTQITGMQTVFKKDVAATVDVMKKQLLDAGLKEDPAKKSKEQRAADLANGQERPVFWM